jgi:hypothetical protein
LLSNKNIRLKISNNTDSYRASIIPAYVCSYCIISACPSFVYLSSLTYNVVISDIPPASGDSMIIVHGSHEFLIGERFHIILCGVVKYYFSDVFTFLYRPYELLAIFCPNDLICFEFFRELRSQMLFDLCLFFLCFTNRFGWRGCSLLCPLFPDRMIRKAECLIRSPLRA